MVVRGCSGGSGSGSGTVLVLVLDLGRLRPQTCIEHRTAFNKCSFTNSI